MNNALVSMKSVCKSFANKPILQNISMAINSGEITTIIGPNGAGKSTLIRLILGLISPDQGVMEKSNHLTTGYMPQKVKIDPTFPISTLRFLQIANMSNEDCHNALELVGIPEVKNTPFHRLSGGEMQRALLARAILRQPNLLVLDEPVQSVDFNGQNELYGLISSLRSSLNCAIIMVSHDLHLVMSSTDHVICLNHHICCQGKPEQVTQDPAYLDIFGETALYNHQHNHKHNLQGKVLDVDGNHQHGEGCLHD
jgi:zinc transport system ATP-binding protein